MNNRHNRNSKQDETYRKAIEHLKAVQARFLDDAEMKNMLASETEVISRYQPLFSPTQIDNLTEPEFRSFLYIENNKHWTGLYRQVSSLTEDFDRLKAALKTLLDENLPLAKRFDDAVGQVKGLGKALATSILLVAYPDRYGVWNHTSEESLKRLGLWPDFERGSTLGQKYEQINRILNDLANDLGIDLWALDTLHWAVVKAETEEEEFPPELETPESAQHFGLERHLQEFLRDNWALTRLGKEWEIYKEPGDDFAGYEYPTDVGRIDILAKHREKPEWLVIELKRDQSTDKTIGQVLRYVGWVKRHMAGPKEIVRAMIISRSVDPAMIYALEALKGTPLTLMRYEIDFKLSKVSENE